MQRYEIYVRLSPIMSTKFCRVSRIKVQKGCICITIWAILLAKRKKIQSHISSEVMSLIFRRNVKSEVVLWVENVKLDLILGMENVKTIEIDHCNYG